MGNYHARFLGGKAPARAPTYPPIAQSAQPIISYNYGLDERIRVVATERLAIITAIACGVLVTLAFNLFPDLMVGLFLDRYTEAAEIAVAGFPLYSIAFIFLTLPQSDIFRALKKYCHRLYSHC